MGGYRAPRSPQALAGRRTITGAGILLVLGAVFESLFAIGVLPPAILANLPLIAPETLPLLAALTLLAGAWLALKGLRGIGDMMVTDRSIVLPVRSVVQIIRGIPNVLPLDRILSAHVAIEPSPGKFEVRYRLAGGQERRTSVSLGFVADVEAFQAQLGIRGVHLVGGSS